MSLIKPTSDRVKARQARKQVAGQRAEQAINQIEEELGILTGSPNNAQILTSVIRILRRQKALINYVRRLD